MCRGLHFVNYLVDLGFVIQILRFYRCGGVCLTV